MTSVTTLPDPARVAEDSGLTVPCREGKVSPEWWFPLRDNPSDATSEWAKVRTVKWLCQQRCPLVQECLAYALTTGQGHGIWAGLGLNERKDIRAGRKPHPYRDESASAA